MNYNNYIDILEYVPIFNNKVISNINLFKKLINFIEEKNIKKILVSLSGGVDSMVLLEILTNIKFDIICCHINYNNRDESKKEKDFLIEYCNCKNIKLEYIDMEITRDLIKRDVYENLSKKTRYDFYKKICDDNKIEGVFLGHHEDDLSENIFNNIMRGGREITDLSVFKEENIILGVKVFRPLLNIKKDEIYKIAHEYQIPYFKDTTPDWSCRGKMRRKIFPECEDCYGKNYNNSLLKIGKESDELGKIINEYLINDLYEKVIFEDRSFKIEKIKILNEFLIFRLLLKKITNNLGIENIKQKNVKRIIDNMNNSNISMILIKDYKTKIDENFIIFEKIK